jgi:DNA repair protein RecN (Recombination protein N)
MLFLLRIENFALIDHLELEFGLGLNVLTGETGAGKSIILDAIDVALGGKANGRMIRTGSFQAILEASFQINSDLKQWLKEQEIELFDDGSVVCCRQLTMVKDTFRSRCRVNGVIVNRHLISQLRDRLLEITAQGQTGQLMLPVVQRELLDAYGGETVLEQSKLVSSAYEKAYKAKINLDSRRESEKTRLQRLDLINYQLKELDMASLKEADELKKLEIERARLAHIFELQQLSYQVYERLYQNEGEEKAAADLLAEVESLLIDMVSYDQELESILEMVRGAINLLIEAAHQINGYGESLEADPDRLNEIEERIRTLKTVCRKYGPDLAKTIAYYHDLQAELKELTDNARPLTEIEKEYQVCQDKFLKLCQKLTELRRQAALNLERQLTRELKPLAMEKVTFECRLHSCSPHSAGADGVEYYFSPNQGENLQPLAEIASGGEMSRFLLALKACFSHSETAFKTLVFDEIDAGVSGKVAQAIAEKLNQLSEKHQVLCVTHQPLIAAMADAHFRVEKHTVEQLDGNNNFDNSDKLSKLRTVVRVKILDNQNHRREELAQLTGGNTASDAIAFANSLLETAASHKQKKITQSQAN